MPVTLESNVLRRLFENVYFVIGTAYAGKSTMVRLLAERYGGVCCGENYHDALMDLTDPEHQPNLGYFRTMSDWQEFIGRTPEEYAAWIDGCAAEAAQLEIIELIRRVQGGKPVFVDTNLSVDLLREISDERRVAVMLCDPKVSVERFFQRPDAEKQFIYRQILQAADPAAAMANYRAVLERVNSPERYRAYEQSGFFTLKRDDRRTPEQTMAILAGHFGL